MRKRDENNQAVNSAMIACQKIPNVVGVWPTLCNFVCIGGRKQGHYIPDLACGVVTTMSSIAWMMQSG
jgi:hypothetical protein